MPSMTSTSAMQSTIRYVASINKQSIFKLEPGWGIIMHRLFKTITTMENETFGMIAVIGIMLSIIIAIVWGTWSYHHHHNKLREYYDNIKIGDRYYFSVGPLHPFDTVQNYYATIIDKKIVDGKHLWVQYRYDDGSVSQNELHEFLIDHKKVSQ